MAPQGLQLQLPSLTFLPFLMLNHMAKLNLPPWKLAQSLPHSSVLHCFIAFLELENNMWLSDLFFSSIVFLNNKNYCIIKLHLWVFSYSSLRAAPLQEPLEVWEWTAFLYWSFPFEKHGFFFLTVNLVGLCIRGLVWLGLNDLKSLFQPKWFHDCGRLSWD